MKVGGVFNALFVVESCLHVNSRVSAQVPHNGQLATHRRHRKTLAQDVRVCEGRAEMRNCCGRDSTVSKTVQHHTQ